LEASCNDEFGSRFVTDYETNFTLLKKSSKKVKLKTLIKKKETSYASLKRCSLLKKENSLKKANSKRLYIKYNLYKKLNECLSVAYVPIRSRATHVYAHKVRVNNGLNQEQVKSNKTINAIVNKQHEDYNNNNNNKVTSKTTNPRTIDAPVVINNSLGDHNEAVLSTNYDALYLDFLISLQHREITPEDYEYLSRLDEMVKKKTVSQNILENLRTDQVTREEKEEEVCGICLDQYVLGQWRKHLPCGHMFHSECIDNWLKNQSTNCPLDKIPVDDSASSNSQMIVAKREEQDYNADDNDDEEEDFNIMCQISGLLDEIVMQIETSLS
jgi:hypothetical protein